LLARHALCDVFPLAAIEASHGADIDIECHKILDGQINAASEAYLPITSARYRRHRAAIRIRSRTEGGRTHSQPRSHGSGRELSRPNGSSIPEELRTCPPGRTIADSRLSGPGSEPGQKHDAGRARAWREQLRAPNWT